MAAIKRTNTGIFYQRNTRKGKGILTADGRRQTQMGKSMMADSLYTPPLTPAAIVECAGTTCTLHASPVEVAPIGNRLYRRLVAGRASEAGAGWKFQNPPMKRFTFSVRPGCFRRFSGLPIRATFADSLPVLPPSDAYVNACKVQVMPAHSKILPATLPARFHILAQRMRLCPRRPRSRGLFAAPGLGMFSFAIVRIH